MITVKKSTKLDNVLYDIRGPVVEEAKRLEDEGKKILKLNTGNPAAFGLMAPDEIIHDMILNLTKSEGYCDSKGLFPARKAVMQYCQQKNIRGVGIEDIYIGNGVSEVILMATQALLDTGDELLIPSPDYPLWTAAANLSGGRAVHYICDEGSNWYPDIEDIKSKITQRTKGIVVISPNNPTGALYPVEILEQIVEIAREHKLIVFTDEIYDKVLYDDTEHTAMASLADDILFVTFNGLSKTYRVAGFRVGWMVVSGAKNYAKDYIEGLTMLASMRLCSNVPGQSIIQTSLGGYQSIFDLTRKGGRLREQRDISHSMITDIPGITCVKPQGAFYLFPKVDVKKFNITDDEKMIYDLLRSEHILMIHGRGFNWFQPDHFRVVFLPQPDDLVEAMNRIRKFFDGYRQT
ncbi:MAG: pyridoxal phosphate-dependent aminotransferase [Chitinispirillales bacterium]|jgi:alanine-synthesizing transaminase|nr:pyridoxal phosphate-dependent aminotransferase [Chitinispirillales bacterium]